MAQVFAASAMMEWHTDKNDKVPRNIFELGLKLFMDRPDFVLAYVDFLVGVGDTENMRQLFERALAACPREAAQKLWDRYIQVRQLRPLASSCPNAVHPLRLSLTLSSVAVHEKD
jgi:cleavage stimulation factor subunit 3